MIEKISPEVAGVIIAIVMSALRILGDEKEDKPIRIFIESLICGALSLTFSYAILAMGLSMFWAAFIGGMIGYLGSATVRIYALRVIHMKMNIRR